MLRRIVVEQSVVDVGENVVGDRRIVVGRIARRRRVTFGAEGTGFGTGIVACGVWQFDRVIGLSAQSSSVAGPVEQGVTDHERKKFCLKPKKRRLPKNVKEEFMTGSIE